MLCHLFCTQHNSYLWFTRNVAKLTSFTPWWMNRVHQDNNVKETWCMIFMKTYNYIHVLRDCTSYLNYTCTTRLHFYYPFHVLRDYASYYLNYTCTTRLCLLLFKLCTTCMYYETVLLLIKTIHVLQDCTSTKWNWVIEYVFIIPIFFFWIDTVSCLCLKDNIKIFSFWFLLKINH